MDDKHSNMLWQMMQSLSANTQEDQNIPTGQPTIESTLLSLKSLLPPKQQKIIELMVKMQELKALINEIQA